MSKLLFQNAGELSRSLDWGVGLLRGALIIFFLIMAIQNLSGSEKIAADFARWGYPDWFRLLTAVLQILGAILLMSPAISFYGAVLLSCILVGAITTHLLFDPPTAAISPAVFITLTVLLCIYYRPEILR